MPIRLAWINFPLPLVIEGKSVSLSFLKTPPPQMAPDELSCACGHSINTPVFWRSPAK
jgi:hypothetical protein